MPIAHRPSPIAGFTLLELALAVFVMAVAIGTSLTAMRSAYQAIDTARNLELAANIMQCELEKERLFDWTQINDATYEPTIDTSFTRNPAIAGRFTLSRTVTAVPNRSNQMARITLTVNWRSYDGRSLSRSTSTYYLQNGLYAYYYSNQP